MSVSADLGCGHRLSWFVAYSGGDEHIGVIVWHPLHPDDTVCAGLGECGGAVFFDIPANAAETRPKWQVESQDPLTLSPSLLCHCGDHGFIRDGQWVPA